MQGGRDSRKGVGPTKKISEVAGSQTFVFSTASTVCVCGWDMQCDAAAIAFTMGALLGRFVGFL